MPCGVEGHFIEKRGISHLKTNFFGLKVFESTPPLLGLFNQNSEEWK